MKKIFKSSYFYISLLIILTLPLCRFLFGSQLIDGHDSTAALIRALSMNKYMGHGQFLVRWSPDVNWGYGYPMFNFYPPLFSFISVLIFQMTPNMILSINFSIILFWVLSGIGMYLFAREFWGDEGGMLSGILYIYAPYHIIDLYIRGAFAESTSFAFFPFILLSFLKINRQFNIGYFTLGAISILGLSLAHNIMSMLFFPLTFVYMIYLYFFENKNSKILTPILMTILGLMMSAFFWLPALIEKKFLNLDFLLSKHYDYHGNFISLEKLFWPMNHWTMDHISFHVGFIYSLLCLSATICIPKILGIKKQLGETYIFFLIVGLIAIFLTLPYSTFLWERISILSFIQFPWRILVIIVFVFSFLSGAILQLIKNYKTKILFLMVLGLFVIISGLITSPQPSYINGQHNIEDFLALGDGEYTPKWVHVPPNGRPDSKFEIAQGRGQLNEEKSLNPVNYKTKFFTTQQQSLLCFHTFYFPGWQVYIDGQATKPYLDNPYGLILFLVPQGDHDIQVVFGSTPIRIIAVIISWAGVFLLLSVIFLSKIYRKKERIFNLKDV